MDYSEVGDDHQRHVEAVRDSNYQEHRRDQPQMFGK